MDFGCGTGSATPFLLNELKLDELVGLDASVQSLAIARHAHGIRARFVPLAEYRPEGLFDLVFCNGVFHHIPPGDRIAAIGTRVFLPPSRRPVRVLGEQPMESRDPIHHAPDYI